MSKPKSVVEILSDRKVETQEGRAIIAEAVQLSKRFPSWTVGQCLRAAYWGVPGEPIN